jgi:tRNA pseudouridine65 synthase
MALPILYQDSELVVVNKTSGLLVHRSLIDRHAVEFAMQMVRDQLGQNVYPVHRLDRPTSGALIFALSSSVARHLANEFSEGRVEKKYLAVVRGVPKQEITVDYALKEELDRKSDAQARADKAAQPAITHFTRLASKEFNVAVDKYPTSRYSLVVAQPVTGRKHQIRRHLSHIKHPIIGDVKYGKGTHNRFFAETLGVRRLLLACTELGFEHPTKNEITRVRAPLSAEFSALLVRLGWGELDV